MILDIPHGTRPTNDAVAILLAELLAATATTKKRRAGFWIPIHWEQWRKILGSRYKATIRAAVEAGYVEANNCYSVGRFPKIYRLAKHYRRPKTNRYILRRTLSTASRIRIDETDTVGQLLVDQFQRVRLTATASGWDGFCAAQIRDRSFYATRCQYGRFHSTFTGLKRAVRGQLRANAVPRSAGTITGWRAKTPIGITSAFYNTIITWPGRVRSGSDDIFAGHLKRDAQDRDVDSGRCSSVRLIGSGVRRSIKNFSGDRDQRIRASPRSVRRA